MIVQSSMKPRLGSRRTSDFVNGLLVSLSADLMRRLIPILKRATGETVHPVLFPSLGIVPLLFLCCMQTLGR